MKFKSNLFGTLGAGVFVGPNTIDFGSVFDDLEKKIAEVIFTRALKLNLEGPLGPVL